MKFYDRNPTVLRLLCGGCGCGDVLTILASPRQVGLAVGKAKAASRKCPSGGYDKQSLAACFRLELLHFLLQLARAPDQFRQLLQRDHLTFRLLVRHGGDAEHFCSVRDVPHYA